MLTKKQTAGPVLSRGRIKRKQKRKKRRLVEAPDQDWKRWDAAAEALGLNWAEFARRCMNQAAWLTEKPGVRLVAAVPDTPEMRAVDAALRPAGVVSAEDAHDGHGAR